MALWGNKDLVTSTGTIGIAITNGLVTGNSTQFVTAGISTGDVINVGAGAIYGYGVVAGITSETVLTLHSTQFLADAATPGVTRTTDVPTGTSFVVSQEPVYAMEDSAYAAPELQNGVDRVIYGIDRLEVGVARTATGESRKYAPTHSGWVGVTTYLANDGAGGTYLRVKTEVLVAGGISTAAGTDNTAEDAI